LKKFLNLAVSARPNFQVAQHMYADPRDKGPDGAYGTVPAAVQDLANIYQKTERLAKSKGVNPVWPTEMGLSTNDGAYSQLPDRGSLHGPFHAYSPTVQSAALVHVYCNTLARDPAPSFVFKLMDNLNGSQPTDPNDPALLTQGFGTEEFDPPNSSQQPPTGPQLVQKPAYPSLQQASQGVCNA